MQAKPLLAIVGGPDVAARVPLMQQLAAHYRICAVGADPMAAAAFAAAGFAFHAYPLQRRLAPLADLRTLLALRRLFAALRPDIVHAFDTKPGVFASIAARQAGVPAVVATITGLGSLYADDRIRTRLVRRVYALLQRRAARHADVTVFQNHDDHRQLLAAGVVTAAKSTVILGSGIDTVAFAPDRIDAAARARVRGELGIPGDAVVVTMIARVSRHKGVHEFAAAAQRLRAQLPEVRFLLVGPDDRDGRDRLTATELAALRRDVVWPGRRDDVPAVLAASDLFVLPTAYREGIPRVLLEAAAMGLPLVATDSPGCNEVVAAGENGRLVPVGDIAALTAAIAELAADAALRQRLGRASRERAVRLFDLRHVAAATHALYGRLLARTAGVLPPLTLATPP